MASSPSRRRVSLRTRIVLAATAVVAVALLVGAAGFVLLLQSSLRDGVKATAEQSLSDLENRVEASGLESIRTDAAPPPASDPDDGENDDDSNDDSDDDGSEDDADDNPVTQNTEDFLANFDDDEAFFQVIDSSGTVVAASDNATGIGRIVAPPGGEAGTVPLPGESGEFLTVVGQTNDLTIITGRSSENIGETSPR